MTCMDCRYLVIDMDTYDARCKCIESLKYGVCVNIFESCEKLERGELNGICEYKN